MAEDGKLTQKDRDKQAALENMRTVVPGVDQLDGIPDVHTFTIPSIAGFEFEVKPLMMGLILGLVALMTFQGMLELHWILNVPICLLISYKVVKDFSSGGDGIKKKNARVRGKLDGKIASVVRGGIPLAAGRRVLIIRNGEALDHKSWEIAQAEERSSNTN